MSFNKGYECIQCRWQSILTVALRNSNSGPLTVPYSIDSSAEVLAHVAPDDVGDLRLVHFLVVRRDPVPVAVSQLWPSVQPLRRCNTAASV